MFSIMWVTLCKHVTCTSLLQYVYDVNALITFVDIGLSVGLGLVGVLLLAVVVITVAIVVACLIRYGKKNKFHAKTS